MKPNNLPDISKLSSDEREQLLKDLQNYKEPTKEWAENGLYVGDDSETEHWFVDGTLFVSDSQYEATNGLSFKTKEQAQLFADKLEALKKIWKFKTENDDVELDWGCVGVVKYYVRYTYTSARLTYASVFYTKDIPFLPYFSSIEIVEKAIEELHDEYILLLIK